MFKVMTTSDASIREISFEQLNKMMDSDLDEVFFCAGFTEHVLAKDNVSVIVLEGSI